MKKIRAQKLRKNAGQEGTDRTKMNLTNFKYGEQASGNARSRLKSSDQQHRRLNSSLIKNGSVPETKVS